MTYRDGSAARSRISATWWAPPGCGPACRRNLNVVRPAFTAGMQEVWASSAISSLAPGRVMLVTDFDGTLAEIVSDPVEAVILPASLHSLERLVDHLRRVAILSSRPTSDLQRLVPLAGADLIGDSGVGHLPIEARMRLDSFNAQAAKLLRTFNGVWLEMKPGATAVHYRHSNASFDELVTVLRPVLDVTNLIAQPGRRV